MKNQLAVYIRYGLGVLFEAAIIPMLPLLISRHWQWWAGWAYAFVCILGYVISRSLAARYHPDIVGERAHILQQEDAKPWDKLILPLWFLSFDLIMLVAGLDELWGWSPPFSSVVTILAFLVFLAGDALGSYALVENRYFSGMARLQADRGHQVISSGPYAWVRHPGYAGFLLSDLATPFCLGSWWACVPLLLLVIVLIVRTRLEDNMLKVELAGYQDYAQRVRYRLLPGIW